MDTKPMIDAAKDQLNRTLSFFSRVDSKASVLLAVNTGMLAILVANMPPVRAFDGVMLIIAVPFFFFAMSYWHLYKEAFPNLKGGHDSLIYFREISKRTESRFIEEFRSQRDEAYINDLLSQIWRNSEILTKKFDHVRLAFNYLALAIFPWLLSLAVLASKNTSLRSLIAK